MALRSTAAKEYFTAEVFAGADEVAKDAARSITEGSVYGKGHKPSVAPNPPNANTQTLNRSIRAEEAGPLRAVAVTDVVHSAPQEFGATIENAFGKGITVVLPERPYMRPAATRGRAPFLKRMVEAVRNVVRASGGA